MTRFRLANKNVAGEIIDDELIIVDLARGIYLNATGSAPLLWRALMAGADLEQAISHLAAASGDPEAFTGAAQAWLEALVAEGVLVREGEGTPITAADLFGAAGPGPVTPPGLERHADLQDLLLYDPVHDLDELGWPKQPGR